MSFLGNLNRKERRQFKKLSNDEKIEILTAEINKKTTEARNKAVAAAFMDGYLFANKMLFEKYIENISDDNRQAMIDELLNEINGNFEKYKDMHKAENKYEEKNNNKEEN